MGQRMSHHPIQNPRANHYIKRKLLEDDNDFAQLLSSTGIHITTRKPSICASFAENKNKGILVFDNRCEVKLNEVERLYLLVKIGVSDFGFCYVGFIAAQGVRIRV
jgi:hypothetical protein